MNLRPYDPRHSLFHRLNWWFKELTILFLLVFVGTKYVVHFGLYLAELYYQWYMFWQ